MNTNQGVVGTLEIDHHRLDCRRPFFPEVLPRIEHGFNTDTMQASKKLVPMSYGDGGTRAMALEHGEITDQIIGAAFEVYSILG